MVGLKSVGKYAVPSAMLAGGMYLLKERILPYLTNPEYIKDLWAAMEPLKFITKYPNAPAESEITSMVMLSILGAFVLGHKLYDDRHTIKHLAGQISSQFSSKLNPIKKIFSRRSTNHAAARRITNYVAAMGYSGI